MAAEARARAEIRSLTYHLPEKVVTNEQLAHEFPDWTAEKITQKLGITERHVVQPTETSGDLAFLAVEKLLNSGVIERRNIDFLLLCTQSPDYFLPTTACLLQDRLGLSKSCGAYDFNLGCSGFVYGLSAAKGLIETDQAKNVLLVTAESYSRFIHSTDRGNKSVFGDAAAATLISRSVTGSPSISSFDFGTDGSGGKNLIVKRGGFRHPGVDPAEADSYLFMDGPEILNFVLKVVPNSVENVCRKAGVEIGDVDYFIFHQANQLILDRLAKKLDLPPEKIISALEHCGNTVSSTLPIALYEMLKTKRFRGTAPRVLFSGFGVGYSWASCLVTLNEPSSIHFV